MFVLALPLTAVTVGTAGVVDGVPTNRYSSFALQQPQKAISAPAPAVQLQKVVELEKLPTVDSVPLQELSP
jgi:hypothetical protein